MRHHSSKKSEVLASVPHTQLLTPHRSVKGTTYLPGVKVYPCLVVRLAIYIPITDSVLMRLQRQNRELISGFQTVSYSLFRSVITTCPSRSPRFSEWVLWLFIYSVAH